jgi:hypothetical protein
MDNQCKRVLDILRERKKNRVYHGLTSSEATDLRPKILRLSAVIFELKRRGHDIETIRHYNKRTRSPYAEYVLRKEAVMVICSHANTEGCYKRCEHVKPHTKRAVMCRADKCDRILKYTRCVKVKQ